MSGTKALAVIQLSNGVHLGVYLGSPGKAVVFNLPNVNGVLSDGGRLFRDTDPGPSEVHAEEITALIKKSIGSEMDGRDLLACHFSQDRIGRVQSNYVARWNFANGFEAARMVQPSPAIVALRECLLFNEATPESKQSPLLETRSFSKNGYLYGLVGNEGYSGLLHFNGVAIALPGGRESLAGLARPESYEAIGAGQSLISLPGFSLTLSEKEAKSLQAVAKDALDELDLHMTRNHPMRRTDPSMPALAAFLHQAAETQILATPDPGKSSPDLRGSIDDLGRVKDLVEAVALASANPLASGIFLAGTVAMKALRATVQRPRDRGDRP